jgi:hypothetical protein
MKPILSGIVKVAGALRQGLCASKSGEDQNSFAKMEVSLRRGIGPLKITCIGAWT